jgi:hypothetical protein
MGSTLRRILIGFALVAGGIMAANGLRNTVTPNTAICYPGWVVLCLIPAYWYGHHIGVVSYAPRDILSTVVAVLVAVAVVKLWSIVDLPSALGLAALVCLFFMVRRRLLPKGRGGKTDA